MGDGINLKTRDHRRAQAGVAAALAAGLITLGGFVAPAPAHAGLGGGNSADSSISGSGRYVAFESEADGLAGPAANVRNIYRYDTKRKKTILISRRSKSEGGAGADAFSFDPSISASGRYIAYHTDADNLGGPAEDVRNIYRYDTKRKKTILISRRSKSKGGAGADDLSYNPSISASGRYVSYSTAAGNLGGPVDGDYNIYRYDAKRKKTILISRRSKSKGGAGADALSVYPSTSASGRYVAYTTAASNLGGPAEDVRNIYRYDTKRKKAILISRRSKSGEGADGYSTRPSISDSGRFISYETAADNLGGPKPGDYNIYRYDAGARKTKLVSRP